MTAVSLHEVELTLSSGLAWIPRVDNFLLLFSLRLGAIIVTFIGAIHPALVMMYVHRDKWEDAMEKIGRILTGSYLLTSLITLISVTAKLYVVLITSLYVYFMMGFIAFCIMLMFVIIIHNWHEGELKLTRGPCIAIPYIIFAILAYFVVVMNSHRRVTHLEELESRGEIQEIITLND